MLPFGNIQKYNAIISRNLHFWGVLLDSRLFLIYLNGKNLQIKWQIPKERVLHGNYDTFQRTNGDKNLPIFFEQILIWCPLWP